VNLPDKQLPEDRCAVCGLVIADGEGRYRFPTHVIHAQCANPRDVDRVIR
jgi:hypothetical protein